MTKVKMRKNNVLIKQVRKKGAKQDVVLHLPENLKSDQTKKALFDLVVDGVGPEVEGVKEGDRVVILHLPATGFFPDPNGDGVLAIVQDDMVQAVLEGE